MSDEVSPEEEDSSNRAWRPSRAPDHRHDRPPDGISHQVRERQDRNLLKVLKGYLSRPLVKVVVAIGLFIAGAVIFDATINGGSWTERAQKPKGYDG